VKGYEANLTLTNTAVSGNSGDGVHWDYGGGTTVTGGRIYANFGDGVEVYASSGVVMSGVEVFGNLGNGVWSSSGTAVTATGNWWGAVDGAGGSGGGSGDEAGASVNATGYLTDGTEYNYFDAGGTQHTSFAIGLPNVSGIPSTEWGGDAARSFLYNIDEQSHL
jgi:hypothetical protein